MLYGLMEQDALDRALLAYRLVSLSLCLGLLFGSLHVLLDAKIIVDWSCAGILI